MGLPADTPCSIVRLQEAGDLPLAVMHNWLPPTYSDITREELEKDGLYALLRDRGVRPVVAHQASGPDPDCGRRAPPPGPDSLAACADDDPQRLRRGGQRRRVRRPLLRAQDYTIEVMIDER